MTAPRGTGDAGHHAAPAYLLPDLPDAPHPGFDLDIWMFGLLGSGLERTHGEYLELLRAAGLSALTVRELPFGAYLIEVAPPAPARRPG